MSRSGMGILPVLHRGGMHELEARATIHFDVLSRLAADVARWSSLKQWLIRAHLICISQNSDNHPRLKREQRVSAVLAGWHSLCFDCSMTNGRAAASRRR